MSRAMWTRSPTSPRTKAWWPPGATALFRVSVLAGPFRVLRRAVGFQAGRDHRVRLDGLLVEVGARPASLVEAIASEGPEVARRRLLLGDEPAEGLETDFQRFGVAHPSSA